MRARRAYDDRIENLLVSVHDFVVFGVVDASNWHGIYIPKVMSICRWMLMLWRWPITIIVDGRCRRRATFAAQKCCCRCWIYARTINTTFVIQIGLRRRCQWVDIDWMPLRRNQTNTFNIIGMMTMSIRVKNFVTGIASIQWTLVFGWVNWSTIKK